MSTPKEIVRGFFRRHHAVPANDAGILWSQAKEDTLLEWFSRLASIVRCGWNAEARRDATPAERQGNATLYEQIVAEIRNRAARLNPSPEIVAACFRASLPTK
jgi:hypothetical protein